MDLKDYSQKRMDENIKKLENLAKEKNNVVVKANWGVENTDLDQVVFYNNFDKELDYYIESFNNNVEAMEKGFGNVPFFRVDFCRVAYLMSIAYGCEPLFVNKNINSKAIIGDNIDDILKLEKKENIHEHGFYPEITKRIKEVQRRYGDVPFIPSDTQSPNDVATQIVHTEPLMLAMFDKPDIVHHLHIILTESIREYALYQNELIDNLIGNNSDYPMPEGIHFSNDNAAFLSPPTYEKFAQPYIEDIGQTFRGVSLHCCMGHKQNIKLMSETNGFIGFDPQPTYNPEDEILKAVTGKSYWRIWDGSISQADNAFENFKHLVDITEDKCGLLLEINAGSKESSLKLAEKVMDYAVKKGRV